MRSYIIGTGGHTRFGKLEASLEALIGEVAIEALVSAQMEAKDIDAIYIGNKGDISSRACRFSGVRSRCCSLPK